MTGAGSGNSPVAPPTGVGSGTGSGFQRAAASGLGFACVCLALTCLCRLDKTKNQSGRNAALIPQSGACQLIDTDASTIKGTPAVSQSKASPDSKWELDEDGLRDGMKPELDIDKHGSPDFKKQSQTVTA